MKFELHPADLVHGENLKTLNVLKTRFLSI
jgi:hypothetical protein